MSREEELKNLQFFTYQNIRTPRLGAEQYEFSKGWSQSKFRCRHYNFYVTSHTTLEVDNLLYSSRTSYFTLSTIIFALTSSCMAAESSDKTPANSSLALTSSNEYSFFDYSSPGSWIPTVSFPTALTDNIVTRGASTALDSTYQFFETTAHEFPNWQRTAVKAATFETLSSALEAGLFVTFFGGSIATAGGVFVVSFVTSSAVYVVNEYAWDLFASDSVPSTSPERLASKAATYRAASILRSLAIGDLLGGAAEASHTATFAIVVGVLDTALYGTLEYSFEKLFADVKHDAQVVKIPVSP